MGGISGIQFSQDIVSRENNVVLLCIKEAIEFHRLESMWDVNTENHWVEVHNRGVLLAPGSETLKWPWDGYGDQEGEPKGRIVIMDNFNCLHIDWVNACWIHIRERKFQSTLNDCAMGKLDREPATLDFIQSSGQALVCDVNIVELIRVQ